MANCRVAVNDRRSNNNNHNNRQIDRTMFIHLSLQTDGSYHPILSYHLSPSQPPLQSLQLFCCSHHHRNGIDGVGGGQKKFAFAVCIHHSWHLWYPSTISIHHHQCSVIGNSVSSVMQCRLLLLHIIINIIGGDGWLDDSLVHSSMARYIWSWLYHWFGSAPLKKSLRKTNTTASNGYLQTVHLDYAD